MPTHEGKTMEYLFMGDERDPMMYSIPFATLHFTSTADDDEPYLDLSSGEFSAVLTLRDRHMSQKKFKKMLMAGGFSRNKADRTVRSIKSYGGQRSYSIVWQEIFLLGYDSCFW